MSKIQVLDYGSIELIESWGSDEGIIEAARMSTNKGFEGWGGVCSAHPGTTQTNTEVVNCVFCGAPHKAYGKGDEKLLGYLYENHHATPFEMAGIIIEVKAPIMVFREWHRHRSQSYNEMSARYTPLPDENYIPTLERLMINASGTNKQAGKVAGSKVLTAECAELHRQKLRDHYASDQVLYERALEDGIPKELARVHLPVGRYSKMRASANLRMVMHFLDLRCAPNAQWEIRQYADALATIVAEKFPRVHALWMAQPHED